MQDKKALSKKQRGESYKWVLINLIWVVLIVALYTKGIVSGQILIILSLSAGIILGAIVD